MKNADLFLKYVKNNHANSELLLFISLRLKYEKSLV